MKRAIVRGLAGALAAVLALLLAGCGKAGEPAESLVYLDYGTGLGESGNKYNRELYGMNGNDPSGADPGCFYVSPEEDPEYGGYYYMYPTSFATSDFANAKFDTADYKERNITNLVARCYRSRDLYNWELAGALEGGYVMEVEAADWCRDLWWAPEVIRNPSDGKYYLYCNAVPSRDYGVEGLPTSSNTNNNHMIVVAVSDTPVGPFDVLYDIDEETGKRIPTINFHTGCGSDYDWAVIDVSPFFDDNGDFYLYFNKHADDHNAMNGMWGVKMLSMTHADYSTVSCVTWPGASTVSNEPGHINRGDVKVGETYETSNEGGINEGVYMIKHAGRYYATYSQYGYGNISYSVIQAVSDDPLKGFRKLTPNEGNPVLDGSQFGVMNGTGHHAIARKGNEYAIIYHRHMSNVSWEDGGGRCLCADRLYWVKNADGLDVLTASGPTKSLQWLDEDVSGAKNLARTATYEVSGGEGVEYLNDGLEPFYSVASGMFFKTTAARCTITLRWDEPVSVRSVMIFNSSSINTAFSKVREIRFKLAKRPSWASGDYDAAVIENLKLPERYCDPETQEYVTDASAVAEFDPILVSEITITLDGRDKYVTEDKLGDAFYEIDLSELVVLGGAE